MRYEVNPPYPPLQRGELRVAPLQRGVITGSLFKKGGIGIFIILIFLLIGCVNDQQSQQMIDETFALVPSNYHDVDAGTADNPFLISSLANLRWLSESPEYWGEGGMVGEPPDSEWVAILKYYFLQTTDIDAFETKFWNDGQGFSPIGTHGTNPNEAPGELVLNLFYGNFNGGGFQIKNLFIKPSDLNEIIISTGLFGGVSNSVLRNIRIENIDLWGIFVSGAIAAFAHNSYIQNSSSTGRIVLDGGGTTGGGIVGMGSNAVIEYCYSRVHIHTSNAAMWGGIAGFMGAGSIRNTYFTGSLRLANWRFGDVWSVLLSFVGDSDLPMPFFAGIAGSTFNTDIEFVYASYRSNIRRLLYTSLGIVRFLGSSTIKNSVLNIDGMRVLEPDFEYDESIVGLVGATTREMRNRETFLALGWDFENVWGIDPDVNNGMPYLINNE